MRRKLVICAVAVTTIAAVAALRLGRARTVRAASGPGNLSLFSVTLRLAGCPIGPGYTFCDQVVGNTSPAETFFINNSGAVSGLAVSIVAQPGLSANFAAGDFTVLSEPPTFVSCTGSLAANSQCEIQVTFSPTTTGLRQAALTVTDTQGDLLAIPIGGTGKNLALAPPSGVTPFLPDNAFTYSGQAVGSASGAETFTLSAGTAETGIELTFAATPGLSSEFANGDFSIASTTCTNALGAGGNCTINVEFTPTAVGLRSASLTATDSDGDTTTIFLAGFGNNGHPANDEAGGLFISFTEPGPNSTTCARINFFGFCNEPNGGSAPITSTFTVQNVSGTQLTGIAVTPPMQTSPPTLAPTDFTVQGTTCTATLAANATCTITVAFTPQGTGVRQGAIGITDAQGDVTGFNLAGYGDDYQLQLASGQQQQLNVAQGSSVTWNALVAPDNVFGANGEQVTLVCPTDLPVFSTCAFNNCPLTITPGANTTFTITIDTSSKIKQAPPVTSACGESKGNAMTPPQMTIRLAPRPGPLEWLFPALALLAAALALGFAVFSRRRARVRFAFAAAGIAAMIFAGCGGGGKSTIGVTPVATTGMTIEGNALDANGNALNAGRPLAITLDVVQGP